MEGPAILEKKWGDLLFLGGPRKWLLILGGPMVNILFLTYLFKWVQIYLFFLHSCGSIPTCFLSGFVSLQTRSLTFFEFFISGMTDNKSQRGSISGFDGGKNRKKEEELDEKPSKR